MSEHLPPGCPGLEGCPYVESISEKAAARALEKIYADVGKGFVTKLFVIAGLLGMGLYLWLKSEGKAP